tara:strand:- start:3626 stop:3820 length:195 start_codon:yes stop_codon:yes gene_type:complete
LLLTVKCPELEIRSFAMSDTEKDFEETVKRLLQTPAKQREKEGEKKKNERSASDAPAHGQVGKK